MQELIGTPVYQRAYSKAGYIASVTKPDNPSFMIGTGSMVPVRHEYQIVWDDGGISLTPNNIVDPWIDAAKEMGLEAVQDTEERLKAAYVLREQENKARQVASDETDRRRAAFLEDARGRVPADAKSVLMAYLVEDKSDIMTDYHGSSHTRAIILGFSTHTRDLFPEMRNAARNHKETAHLADADDKAEHREKYSMGGGYYLKEGYRHSCGWKVTKETLYKGADSIPTGEWSLAEASADTFQAKITCSGSMTIEKHVHTKKGFDMWICIMADRVERDEFNRLREAAKAMGGWYSRKWGTTPAGFAFKDLTSAEAFAGSPTTPSDGTPRKSPHVAEKMHALADKLQGDIDNKLGDRMTNTPKRMREAGYARQEGHRLKRTQEALRALADHHEAGTLPAELASVTTKKAVYGLMQSHIDRSKAGYYDAGIDTGKPAKDTPRARALWNLIQGQSEDDKKAEEIRRKVEALQFSNMPGYFPTPPEVISQMIEAASIPEGERVRILEPSAGSGAILDALSKAFPSTSMFHVLLSCCERQHSLKEVLQLKGYKILCDDFTELEAPGEFDRVLMNPPFEKGQDAEHVQRAFSMLRPGGRLVAIMSPGPFFRSDSKSVAFREWFEMEASHKIDLPANSFKQSGTGTGAVMVTIHA